MGHVLPVPTPALLRRALLPLVMSIVTAACSGTPSATLAPSLNPAPQITPASPAVASTPAERTSAPTPTMEPTPAPTPLSAEPLAIVAALVGDDTATVFVSDWDRIRGGAPAPAATDPAERLRLMRSIEPRAPAAGFAMSRLRGHREAWGWDTFDLAWEATLVGRGAPVFVLGTSPGFDLTPVLAHFRDRNFTEERRGSALVLSRPLDLAEPWLNTTELAIHTTAIFEDAGLMVLSSSAEELTRALDRVLDRLAGSEVPAGSRAAAFAAAVAGLGEVDAAAVELRSDLCAALAPRGDPALAAIAATLHPWTALAAGWRTDAAGAAARFAIAYDDPALASADLAGRARLAREGTTGDGRPLIDVTFRLLDARVDGDLVLLDVQPAGGLPVRIQQAFLRRDLPFAACG